MEPVLSKAQEAILHVSKRHLDAVCRLAGSQRDGSGSAHLVQATCRLEFLNAPAELARIGAEPDQAAADLATQRTPLETMSRTSSTGERQESGWISVRLPGGAADLPPWAASQPSLLWLRVQAGVQFG